MGLLLENIGVENVAVARYMFAHRQWGTGRSFVVGKSCSSQRIERLWRDMFTSSLSKFYCVFWYLEDAELLNITDELQLFVLCLVFKPRINEDLIQFQNSWDKHPLRTIQDRTPHQSWVLGQIHYTPSDEVTNVDN